jgi:hypothetical protein
MEDTKAKRQLGLRPTVRITLTKDVKAATAALGVEARRLVSTTA